MGNSFHHRQDKEYKTTFTNRKTSGRKSVILDRDIRVWKGAYEKIQCLEGAIIK